MTQHHRPGSRRPDPVDVYRSALRAGDTRLAELLHRRLVAAAAAARILRSAAARLGLAGPPPGR